MTEPTTKKRVPCEVYSRIVGYLRPVQNWNKGKRREFNDRRTYDWRAAVEEAPNVTRHAQPLP